MLVKQQTVSVRNSSKKHWNMPEFHARSACAAESISMQAAVNSLARSRKIKMFAPYI
jgi:hypothetical protein